MFVLESEIVIGDYIFKEVNDVEITKSVDELGDTAVVKLPTRFKVRQNDTEQFTETAIKVGDPIKITLGYDKKYSGVEFEGWVKKISPKIPLEIHCEDDMWLLRRKNINKAWNDGTTLLAIVKEVISGTAVELDARSQDFKVDKFIIQNASGAKVLQQLKQDFGISAFITDERKLYVGLSQLTNIGEEVKYDLNYNVIENSLEYKSKEERKIKVRYTYIDKQNKRKTIEVGDEDGELRTFHTSVVSEETKLKEMATAEVDKLKYDGYGGSLTGFLIPFATRGMKVNLEDQDYPDRKGSYFVNKVNIRFGLRGARREVFISNKL